MRNAPVVKAADLPRLSQGNIAGLAAGEDVVDAKLFAERAVLLSAENIVAL